MPVKFWFAIILGIIAVIALIVASTLSDPDERKGGRWVAAIVGFFAALLVLFSSLTQIGTQEIGVLTTFGHPSGSLPNGLHWKAPWQKVTRLDGKMQTDTYASDDYNGRAQDGAQGNCINVRIARQAKACVNVAIRWQNQTSGIDYLFRNYHTDDGIRVNLMLRDLQSAMNQAFASYDPLGIDTNGNSTQPSNADLQKRVLAAMQQQVGKYLDIQSVFIPIFNFDPDTQKRLNQLQLQVAQTRIAQQAEQTAAAQAAANRQLAASVSHDSGVLTDKCLNILAEAVQKGMQLPAGFSCFAGGANTSVAVK